MDDIEKLAELISEKVVEKLEIKTIDQSSFFIVENKNEPKEEGVEHFIS